MKPAIYKDLLHIPEKVSPKDIDLRDVFMNLAFMLSLKSTCRRAKAGCVITKDQRIISVGYNGVPPKQKECIERDECRQKGSKIPFALNIWEPQENIEVVSEGCFDSLHAETNALGFCLQNGINTSGSIIYLTMAPCKSCAQMMVSSGVKRIYFADSYRDIDGLLYLKTYGVEAVKLKRS